MDIVDMKVSFDFDSTLDQGDVQHFVKYELPDECEVWIVTSRLPDHKAPSDNWNVDLFYMARKLDIPKERIVFTSYTSKHEFFWEREDPFLFHLDDDEEEIRMINGMTDTKGILFVRPDWKRQIEELL